MLIDTNQTTSVIPARIRVPYYDRLVVVCRNLAGYRDIESYISTAIDRQMSPQDFAIFREFQYKRGVICL